MSVEVAELVAYNEEGIKEVFFILVKMIYTKIANKLISYINLILPLKAKIKNISFNLDVMRTFGYAEESLCSNDVDDYSVRGILPVHYEYSFPESLSEIPQFLIDFFAFRFPPMLYIVLIQLLAVLFQLNLYLNN